MSRTVAAAMLAMALVSTATLAPSTALAGGKQPLHGSAGQGLSNNNSLIVPPQSKTAGKSYGEWAAAYAKWTMPIPVSLSFFDDGHSFSLNQSGPVWFLQPGCMNRNCTLPADTYLFAPFNFGWNEYPCPDPSFQPAPGQSMEDFLLSGITPFFDANPPADGSLLVDGKPLTGLANYRGTSKLFNVTFDASWNTTLGDPCAGLPSVGSLQPCVIDGYWVMIKPLPPGPHTLEYPGCDVIHLNVLR